MGSVARGIAPLRGVSRAGFAQRLLPFLLAIKALPTPAAGFASLLRSPPSSAQESTWEAGAPVCAKNTRSPMAAGWLAQSQELFGQASSPVSRQDHPISQIEPGLVYPLTCHMIFIHRSTTGSTLSAFLGRKHWHDPGNSSRTEQFKTPEDCANSPPSTANLPSAPATLGAGRPG